MKKSRSNRIKNRSDRIVR